MHRPIARALASAAPLIALAVSFANIAPVRATAAETAVSDTGSVEVIQLDRVRSQVDFRIRLVWLLRVGGRFGQVSGNVRVDHFRNQISVDAHIDVNAISMDNESSEEWAKSAEFFDAAAHPQIDFVSDPFPQARLRTGGEVTGSLTLRGIRRQIRFELQPAACDRPAYDCPIEVAGSIRRSMFGMHSRHGTLGDRVELQLRAYAAAPR